MSQTQKNKWTRKKWIVFALTAFLVVMCVRLFYLGQYKDGSFVLVGCMLGAFFIFTGKRPVWHWEFRRRINFFGRGSGIVEDDDPGNISPKIYLSLISGAILIAIVSFLIYHFELFR